MQQFVDPLGHARPVVDKVTDAVQRVSDGLRLRGVDQLWYRSEVDVVATVLDPGTAPRLGGGKDTSPGRPARMPVKTSVFSADDVAVAMSCALSVTSTGA